MRFEDICNEMCMDFCRWQTEDEKCYACPLNQELAYITEHQEVMSKAIEAYGRECQIDKAIEEMSELTKALLKLRHTYKDCERQIIRDSVDEEMADVHIMITQLDMIFGNSERVSAWKNKKIERMERRLKGERFERH